MNSFSIDYSTAAKLLRESAATADTAPDDNYIVNGKAFPAQLVNKLVKKQINRIAAELDKEKMATVVYSSGQLLDSIFGAKNILSNAFGVQIETAADTLTKDSFHPDTTMKALLRYIAR
jgi:hypothetical protein